MVHEKLDAYIVPSADPHQTEYTHPHWRSRAWLSGFTGSVGTVVVLQDEAGLWTDGRYFIQADRELQGSEIDLFKMNMPGVPELIDWLVEKVPQGGVVGLDGRLITASQAKKWRSRLGEKTIRLVCDVDLVEPLWMDRPALPAAPAKMHAIEFAGCSVADKLGKIREAMAERAAETYLLSSLYDIAWLFNIRGNDTPHTPLLTAYALVEMESAMLFTDEQKISTSVRSSLSESGVEIKSYESVFASVENLPESCAVYLCEDRVSTRLRQSIPTGCRVIDGKDLTELPKARKNPTEIKNWVKVHELDGAAMVRFWKWQEKALANGESISECDAADKLEAFRRASPECLDISFTSISAYGPNGAIVHYAPRPEICAKLLPQGLYLIDSGGQYEGGTTDITRTIALGEPTDGERTDYTLVLKGLINLSSARFPKGTAGNNLDVLARQFLWEHGMDYAHGTGHGVGYYLNVHEGPQNLSQSKRSDTPLEPGMVVTIEPGIYKENRHGIRIENMVVVVDDGETESGAFYRFDTITLCPIDTAPLKLDLLVQAEIDWLNEYHRMVYDRLSPHLSSEERDWLAGKTQPVSKFEHT